jgi:hypothetical protein
MIHATRMLHKINLNKKTAHSKLRYSQLRMGLFFYNLVDQVLLALAVPTCMLLLWWGFEVAPPEAFRCIWSFQTEAVLAQMG